MEYVRAHRRIFPFASMESWSRHMHARLNIPFTVSQNLQLSFQAPLSFAQRGYIFLKQGLGYRSQIRPSSTQQQDGESHACDDKCCGSSLGEDYDEIGSELQKKSRGTKRTLEPEAEPSKKPAASSSDSCQSSKKRRRTSSQTRVEGDSEPQFHDQHAINKTGDNSGSSLDTECQEQVERTQDANKARNENDPSGLNSAKFEGSVPPILFHAGNEHPKCYPSKYDLRMIQTNFDGEYRPSIPITERLLNEIKTCLEGRRRVHTEYGHLNERRQHINKWCKQLVAQAGFLGTKRRTVQEKLKTLPHSYLHNQLKAIDKQYEEGRKAHVELDERDKTAEKELKELEKHQLELEWELIFITVDEIFVNSNIMEEYEYEKLENLPECPFDLPKLVRDRTLELAEFWAPHESRTREIRHGCDVETASKTALNADRIGEIAKKNEWSFHVPKTAERAEEKIKRGEAAMADVREAQKVVQNAVREQKTFERAERYNFESEWDEIQQSGQAIGLEEFADLMDRRREELDDKVREAQHELDHYVSIGRRQGLILGEDGYPWHREDSGDADESYDDGRVDRERYDAKVAEWVDKELAPDDEDYWWELDSADPNADEICPPGDGWGENIEVEKQNKGFLREVLGRAEKRRNSV